MSLRCVFLLLTFTVALFALLVLIYIISTQKDFAGKGSFLNNEMLPSSSPFIRQFPSIYDKDICHTKKCREAVSVTTDHTNNTYSLLKVNEPSFGLNSHFLSKGLKLDDVKAYQQFQVDLAISLGANPNRAKIEMLDALEFEIKLANASLSKTQTLNDSEDTYNVMTLAEVQKRWNYIQWMEFINKLMPQSQITVFKNERILVSNLKYFDRLENILQETDNRTQANYVMWKAALASVPFLGDEIDDAYLRFITASTGQLEREPRWKKCSSQTAYSFGIAVSAMYIRKHFKTEYKAHIQEIVENIREAFVEMLQETDWMDDFTKNNAIQKARDIHTHIAFPVELLSDKYLEEFYQELELKDQDFYLNSLKLTKFHTNLVLKKLRQRVNKTHWSTHSDSIAINDFYASVENSFEFPAGILQGAFYDMEQPKYMHYGTIGMVIGHELSHAFDEKGRQFDNEGNLHNWWSNGTLEAFLNKTNCITDQYNNYKVPELGLNLRGLRTQSENVADNVGIKQAYRAYQSWVKRNKPESKLIGLSKYTPNQLFWISSANIWCNKLSNETLKQYVLTGVHPPAEFRVRGSFSNSEAFSNDFNCPPGSNMNPKQKCSIW